MRQLSAEARQQLDRYLGQVKVCLEGATGVDAEEIERDITEHIEQELESAAEPVDVEVIEQVLARLGSPRQWAPEEALSWVRKMALRLRNGPDDWRLAYITIGIFVIACISGPGAILLLPLSFYFARVTLSVADGPQKIGNQKYLLYPPLVCFNVLFTVVGLAIPFCLPVLGRLFAHQIAWRLHAESVPQYRLVIWFFTLAVAGAWWLTAGALSWNRATKIYYPLPERFTRRISLVVCCIGVLLMGAGLALSLTWAS